MSQRYRGRESVSWKSGGASRKSRVSRLGSSDERGTATEKSDSSHSLRDEHKGHGNGNFTTFPNLIVSSQISMSVFWNNFVGRNSPSMSHSRSDDTKISSQTRIMARLESVESFRKACQQIQDLLYHSENKSYIIRFFSCLTHQFSEVFSGLTRKPVPCIILASSQKYIFKFKVYSIIQKYIIQKYIIKSI